MGWIPTAGDRVTVEGFGAATVVRTLHDKVLVNLDRPPLPVEVPLGKVSPTQPAAAPLALPEIGPTGAQAKQPDPERMAIEALRFGLVPEDGIESFTLGFEEVRIWVIGRLPETHGGGPHVAEVSGPFGSGKSHTMAVVRYVAKQRGYLVARVAVDGNSVTLSDPERLLYALWATLHAADLRSTTPLLDLSLTAIQKGHPAPSVAPRGIDRVRDNYGTARLLRSYSLVDAHGYALDAIMSSSYEFTAADVTGMISSERAVPSWEVRVRRMIGQHVDERPYDFIAAWVGYALLARLAGYKGLVITIDEFEVERFHSAPRTDALLTVVSKYLKGELDHPRAPLGVFFATVGAQGHRGDAFIDGLLDSAGDCYVLPVWSAEDRAELARWIFAHYASTYGVDGPYPEAVASATEQLLERQGSAHSSGLIRSFIKNYVAALDSIYGPRN